MDDEIKAILTELNLEDEIENFEKNKITMNILNILDQQMITELIKDVGPRAIFLDYWKKHFKKEDNSISKKRKHSSSDDEIIHIATYVKPLEDILKCIDGERIIEEYDIKKQLTESMRNKLCGLIIRDLKESRKRLTNDMAKEIGLRIINRFPTEVLKTYYVAPVKKKDSLKKKSEPASGKLLVMWRNSNRKQKNTESSSNAQDQDKLDNNTENIQLTEDIQQSIDWLKVNVVPWPEVLEHWDKTFAIRRKEMEDSNDKNLETFFSQWPILKGPDRFSLILRDFKLLKLSSTKLTLELWESFFNIIKKYRSTNFKDATATTILERINSSNISADSLHTLNLMLLCHLMPPKGLIKFNKKEIHKFSIGEAKNNLILHVQTPADLTKARLEAKDRALSTKQTLQPYLIVIGNLLNIEEIYVCADEVIYKASSVLEGIDLCFKIFFVLQLEYPRACQHIWLAIQKGIYRINVATDPTMPFVEDIIDRLKKELEIPNTPEIEEFAE